MRLNNRENNGEADTRPLWLWIRLSPWSHHTPSHFYPLRESQLELPTYQWLPFLWPLQPLVLSVQYPLTAGLHANAIGRAFQNRGRESPSRWIRAWIFFILPRPSEKPLACWLKTSSRTGVVSDVLNLRKGQSSWMDSNHSLPKRVGPSFFIT